MGALLGLGVLIVAGYGLHAALRWWMPARLPDDARFAHELHTSRSLREVAEELARRFADRTPSDVVCLGPVRGNAARILFHAGPRNVGQRVHLYRHDYLLHVRRVAKDRVRLELALAHPYSYLRPHRGELSLLLPALEEAFGDLDSLA